MDVNEQFADASGRFNEGQADHGSLEKFWVCLVKLMFKAGLAKKQEKADALYST